MKDKIAVVGFGQMGSGIAQVFAQSGYRVSVYDASPDAIKKGMSYIEKNLNRALEKGRITESQMDDTLSNLTVVNSLDEISDVDLVVEAVIENENIKREMFSRLDAICKDDCILATNTSSIPIISLATATKRPHKVVGMHFMNPVPVMKLVEVISSIATSEETTKRVNDYIEQLGKIVVHSQDYPGFIVNRILMPMINEAVRALMEGVASVEDIDKAMKFGCNHPMGPLALADLIGLDTCLYILEVLYRGLGDQRYAPCPLLKQYVQAGYLGRKSGRGFYEYS